MNSFRGIFQGFYLDFKNAVWSPSSPPSPARSSQHILLSPLCSQQLCEALVVNLNVNVHLHQYISSLWLFAACLLLFAGDLWLFAGDFWLFPGSFGCLLVVLELLWWSVVIACFSDYRLFLRLHQLTESGSRSRVCDENWKIIEW